MVRRFSETFHIFSMENNVYADANRLRATKI